MMHELVTNIFKHSKGEYSVIELVVKNNTILKSNNYINKRIKMGVRLESIYVESNEDFNIFKTYVTMVERMGLDTYIYFDIHGVNCIVKMNINNEIRIANDISFYIDKEKIHVFDYETSLRII